MTDEAIRQAVLDALNGAEAPAFDVVAGGPVRRRLRVRRVAAALLFIVALGVAASFVLPPLDRKATQVALLQSPTTDWLLRTPDPGWVASLQHPANEETSNVR